MNDTYKVLHVLASGGTAVLYKAIQTSLDRTVAIKRLHAHLLSDPDFARRFRIEAKAAAMLDHENIVRIIDFGTFEGDSAIVMEYIEGRSLKEILSTEKILDAETTLLIAREICLGLDHAHRRGVVHRDIKPGNILVNLEGKVKIADFGLAKLFRPDAQETIASTMLGTPLYMAPEQAAGETLDGRADLFSLGAVCYEALTGSRPFSADSYAAVIDKILRGKVTPPSKLRKELRPDIEAIVMKALARDPDDRYPSAKAMAEAIESALGKEILFSSQERISRLARGNPTTLAATRRSAKRKGKRAFAAAGIAIIATLSVFVMKGTLLRIVPESLRRAGNDPTAAPLAAGLQEHTIGTPGLKMIPLEEQGIPGKSNEGSYLKAGDEMPLVPSMTPIDSSSSDSASAHTQAMDVESKTTDSSGIASATSDLTEKGTSETGGPEPETREYEKLEAEERKKQGKPLVAVQDSNTLRDTALSDHSANKISVEIGYLEITVDPPAAIAIDGEKRTAMASRISIELPVGLHEISCSLDGYKKYVETLRIYKGELSRRRITLQEITGFLEVSSEQGALLVVDGYPRGSIPLDKPIQLSPGRHKVELKKPGRLNWSGDVYITAEETLRLSIELVPTPQGR